MKPIKQKGETFVEYAPSLENVVESLLYNPTFMKIWNNKMKNGSFLRSMKGILDPLQKLNKAKLRDFDLYYIAQSHLDAAWLFPVVDTKLRAYKTFYKAIEHIEKYPFFTFSQTSPQYFQWIKAYSTKANLWEKVKQYVKDGRFEPTGGMWIEPTLDELSGESLVRQRMYGQLWFLREFGRYPQIESLLDVFGFCQALPQILVKSGAKAFWTTKCTWNDTNPWPISNYLWRGIDGTDIFTHQFKFQWMAIIDMGRYYKTARFPKPENKKAIISSRNTNAEIEAMMGDERLRSLGIFYGWGDGARGPLEVEIGFHKLLSELGHGQFTITEKYFNTIQKQVGDKLLIWDDEMYLENHRGTKTTQVLVKQYHRQAELWVMAVEKLWTMVNLASPKIVPFEKPAFFEIWRRVLFNEFHDILPGSSIPEVYKLAHKELQESTAASIQYIQTCLQQWNAKPEEVVVFNPFNWIRSEYVIHNNYLLHLENIAPLSVQKIELKNAQVNPAEWENIAETDNTFILENETIRATVFKASGTLISLYYKPTQSEMLQLRYSRNHWGAQLMAFRDPGGKPWYAWNIHRSYARHMIPIHAIEPAKLEKSRLNVPQVVVKFQFLGSSVEMRYKLMPKDAMVRISIHTDIKDPEVQLKYQLPLALKSEDVQAEIPYASITRKRKKRTEMEKAKWEMPMQKWVDISDPEMGLTVVNNNRNGFAATPNALYITLQRTPRYPGPGYFGTFRLLPPKERPKYTDMKPYDFELGLIPHKGNWKAARVWEYGYSFNLPLILAQQQQPILDAAGKPEPTPSPTTIQRTLIDALKKSLVIADNPNILVGSIKPPEWAGKELEKILPNDQWTWDQKTFILRLVEQSGENCTTSIKIADFLKISRIEEVSLLEMEPSLAITIANNSFALQFHKFEIKTLRIFLK